MKKLTLLATTSMFAVVLASQSFGSNPDGSQTPTGPSVDEMFANFNRQQLATATPHVDELGSDAESESESDAESRSSRVVDLERENDELSDKIRALDEKIAAQATEYDVYRTANVGSLRLAANFQLRQDEFTGATTIANDSIRELRSNITRLQAELDGANQKLSDARANRNSFKVLAVDLLAQFGDEDALSALRGRLELLTADDADAEERARRDLGISTMAFNADADDAVQPAAQAAPVVSTSSGDKHVNPILERQRLRREELAALRNAALN